MRYVSTVAAQDTIELRRGRRVVRRMRRTAERGRNTITIRMPRARGRYALRLTAAAGTQRATDRARLTVT